MLLHFSQIVTRVCTLVLSFIIVVPVTEDKITKGSNYLRVDRFLVLPLHAPYFLYMPIYEACSVLRIYFFYARKALLSA